MGTAVILPTWITPLSSQALALPAYTVSSCGRPAMGPGKPGAWAGRGDGYLQGGRRPRATHSRGKKQRFKYQKTEDQVQKALSGKGSHEGRNRAPKLDQGEQFRMETLNKAPWCVVLQVALGLSRKWGRLVGLFPPWTQLLILVDI